MVSKRVGESIPVDKSEDKTPKPTHSLSPLTYHL